ncbi:MAG: cytochrome c oxidase subunit 3 [Pyrinomonadaceae bacterium]|nr:cytochrome c oxidase subunit 3 [Pyrinomonadaceae bacterium]
MIDTEEQNSEKSRVITWVVLLVVLMTFGGLIGAYIVIATNKVLEWQPFSLPVAVWISTALIIVSSLTFYFGHRAILHNDEPRIRKYLVATTALGGMFIASQLISWIALASRGLYVQGNPYAGFFYILTAIHAVHVLGGIIAPGVVVLRAWYVTGNETETTYRQRLSTAVSWYWHFMGAIWIVLFLLLGFWR